MGGIGILVNLLAIEASPEKYRRQALAGLHFNYAAASFVAPLLVNMFYGSGYSWHGAFGFLALGPLIMFAASFLHRENKKDREITVRADERRALKPQNLSLLNAVFLGAAFTGGVVGEVSLSSRLALYARRDLGRSPLEANDLLSGFFLAFILGRLLFTAVRIPLKSEVILVFSALASITLVGIGLNGVPAVLAISGFSISIFYPCALAFIDEKFAGRAAWVVSWCQVAQGLGLVAMQFAIGAISDKFSLGTALWIGPLAFAIPLVYFFPRIQKKIAL
jgi:fucose permease